MSNKYIQEIQNKNFVYPNNNPWEYGIDLIQNINNNSVSGTVSNFVTSISAGNLNVSFNYTWSSNGADTFLREDNTVSILSVHLMSSVNLYYKPWRMVGFVHDNDPLITTKTGVFSTVVTPAMLGQASISAAIFYFEIRMIGKKEIYPICVEVDMI